MRLCQGATVLVLPPSLRGHLCCSDEPLEYFPPIHSFDDSCPDSCPSCPSSWAARARAMSSAPHSDSNALSKCGSRRCALRVWVRERGQRGLRSALITGTTGSAVSFAPDPAQIQRQKLRIQLRHWARVGNPTQIQCQLPKNPVQTKQLRRQVREKGGNLHTSHRPNGAPTTTTIRQMMGTTPTRSDRFCQPPWSGTAA